MRGEIRVSSSQEASSSTFLRSLVTDALLSGQLTSAGIMKHLGLTDSAIEKQVKALLDDPGFLREAEREREQVENRVIKWFKQRGLKYAERMDKLSENGDPRVAFQATKDALDRIGTGAAQKVAITGAEAYRALLEELRADGKRADTTDESGETRDGKDVGVSARPRDEDNVS